MKLHSHNKSERFLSYPYKHSTPERSCKRRMSRNLSTNLSKSRNDFNKYANEGEQNDMETQQIEEEDLKKLREEAFADLHAQLQQYNNDFIAHIRYEENSPSSSSYSETSEEDSSIQELVDLFETGTVKDYSQFIEWESYKNPSNDFDCHGEYGNLW